MKLIKSFIGLLLVFALSIVMVACNGTGEDTTTVEPGTETIAGEYLIDISDLGMPLKFYLRIDDEDKFILSPDRKYDVDKGSGTIGSSASTYMLIYSDSTADNTKNTTFEMSNGNIDFKTDLHYGTSKLPVSKEDEENPDITYYLQGKTLLYEDYYGEYAGSHTVKAMGQNITYTYSFKFGMGRSFTFLSEFVMSKKDYEYIESGYYDVVDGQITLHIQGEKAITGNFDSDMNLVIPVKASDRGDREEQTLQLATTAACSNNYYGHLEEGGAVIDFSLYIDKYGGYEYEATSSLDGTITETGSFTIDNEALTFSPSDVATIYEGTLKNFILTGNLPIKSDGTRSDLTLYCQTIQGSFTAEGEDADENVYAAELELLNDGTFTFKITKGTSEVIVDETGTFTVTKAMFVQLVLTGQDTAFSAVLSDTGINMSIDIEEDVTVGFSLSKDK